MEKHLIGKGEKEKMKITTKGTDFITIDEDNMYDEKLKRIERVHLIKLSFFNPTEEKVRKVLKFYPKTNRFVIDDNIREYNSILKWTNKKYYVENTENTGFISFFRKNNKVILNINRLTFNEKMFVLNHCFEDVLKNIEVIWMDRESFDDKKELLKLWNGNVIVDI
jgi:hypothetical protein